MAPFMFGKNFYATTVARGEIPTVFPNRWVRSCLAIDSIAGMINWVVDGNLIEKPLLLR